MSNRRTLFVIFFSFLFSLGLSAADQSFPQSEFVVNVSSAKPDLRPYAAYNADEAQILTALYEGLYVYDPYNMDPLPALAQSGTVSKNRLEWTFKIRDGARFENGDPITSAEIRASWLNLIDPKRDAPYASLFDSIEGVAAYRTGALTDPLKVGIVAQDKKTLIVRLVTPAEQLPKILCHHAFSVVHPSDLNRTENEGKGTSYRPVSSGSFKVKSMTETEIVLIKNPAYWDASNVALPSIKILISEDESLLTARYNQGEIHWLAGSSLIDKILDPDSIHVTPMFSTEYFFFRSTWGPWADSKIRNALLLAVPWTDLRSKYLIPAKTLVLPIAGYPELAGISTQNIEEAKKKLIEAGVLDASKLAPLIILIPESEAFSDLAVILEKAWKTLGFKIEVKSLPYSSYYASLKNNDYSVGITSWIGDFEDPLSFLEMFRPNSSLNDSGWKSPDFEALIQNASTLSGSKDRYAKLAEAEKLLLDEGVILPIAHNPSLNVIDINGISGWYTNTLDIHPFKFIKFVQKKALPGVAML